MNQFIEYICRGVVRSEDAISRLNKHVTKLTKCVRITNTRVTCVAIAGLCFGVVIAMQDKEIKELQKQVADLAKKSEGAKDPENVVENTEEQNQQEGA